MKIDKQFFKKYQRLILWLANSFLGKLIFQFEKMGHELRSGEKIDRITPNSIRYKNKNNSYTEQFFSRNEYALKLAPLVWWIPIELITEGLNGGKAILRPVYQLALIALFLKIPQGIPLLGLTTADFYPDADPESTSVDGYTGEQQTSEDWLTLVDAVGTTALDAGTNYFVVSIRCTATQDKFSRNYRVIALFDTSALEDEIEITGATLSFYGNAKNAQIVHGANVYSSNPASDTGLVAGDYDSLGSTAFCDTEITAAAWSTSSYNVFALNASGLAAISKTGISKFGTRDPYLDVARNAPTWITSVTGYMGAHAADNGSNKPKLSVTYPGEEDNSPLFGCNF